jgi:hypothetical protein
MVGYSSKAQPYLDAIAMGFFASQQVRDWLIDRTPQSAAYKGALPLLDAQRAKRWAKGQTKQPFWSNYHCGLDSRCTCRISGSRSLESDAIFFMRNANNRTLAIHVEFKHRGEPFTLGQPEGYPLRAECFSRTHKRRPTLNAHDNWITVLFCDAASLSDPRTANFQRIITHADAVTLLAGFFYPT